MILAVYNSKGGVGKTISAVNLAALFAQKCRVLLMDLDAQYSATSFFLSNAPQSATVAEVLLDDVPLAAARVAVEGMPNLALVPASARLESAARQLPDLRAADGRLSRALRQFDDYDLCILDCPSRYDAIARNALMAATHLLVPLNSERMAFDCAFDTTTRAGELREDYNRDALPFRVLLTGFRGNTINAQTILAASQSRWPDNLCQTRIRHTEKIRELSSRWSTVATDAAGTARADYQSLADELATWMDLSLEKTTNFSSN